MRETWTEHVSRKFNEKLDEYKAAWTTAGYIEDIRKYMEKIKKEVENGKTLTDINKLLNSEKNSLLERLQELYEHEGQEKGKEGVYWGKNLARTGRSVWNSLARNFSRSNDAKVDKLKEVRENIKKGDYKTYKPCMRNMLKMLELENKKVDWLTRLDIMSDEKLVQTDYFFFGTNTRWNKSVRDAAKDLKKALEDVTKISLESSEDYKIFFNGAVEKLYYYDNSQNMDNEFETVENVNSSVDNPIYQKRDDQALKKVIEKLIKYDSNLKLRKYKTDENYYAIIPKSGVMKLIKLTKDQYDKYKSESVTFERVMEP